MKALVMWLGTGVPVMMAAQPPVNLPPLTVYSERVANQVPAGTIAMPVSLLRFEPRLDIQARNLAEGQADITLRGGIFENTGFQIGAVSVTDPQTGHYFAELPIAPALLTAPEVRTGVPLALGVLNATVGAIGYQWRPIRTAGMLSAGAGEYGLRRGEFYQGFVLPVSGHARVAADVDVARSESDGSVPFGEHEFDRANVRLQYVADQSQTDLFAGYQGKRFGWPNLYTPFNSNETENLQTLLVAFNQRTGIGRDEFFEFGAYHRRNKDDYAFNRFAPVGAVHPFQHTTGVDGGAATLRRSLGSVTLNARAEVLADKLTSTSLTFGRYRTRTMGKLALVPEKAWNAPDGGRTVVRAGASYDDSNRDHGSVSPVAEVAREFAASGLRRISLGYTKTSQLPTYTALNSSATAGLFRGNPSLGRERAHQIELAASGALAGWAAEGALFWRRDDDLVDWTFRRGVTARTANAVDIEVGGIELLARKSWAAIDVVVSYTGLTKDADYRGALVDGSFYALNYARHRVTAAATWRVSRELELRLDNAFRIQADNPLRTRGGDESVLTAIGVSYRPLRARGLELSAQVDNVWDSEFQDVPAVPAARRQFSAGVTYLW